MGMFAEYDTNKPLLFSGWVLSFVPAIGQENGQGRMRKEILP
jgi:hypothetical protein